MKASLAAITARANRRILKAAEKRAKARKTKKLTNADHVRELAIVALRTAKEPLTLYALTKSFADALKFNVRDEFLVWSLLHKQKQTGIRLVNDEGITFGLREWEVVRAMKTKAA